MASLRKALRGAWAGKRYNAMSMEGKENQAYVETPHSKRTTKKAKCLSERRPSMRSEKCAYLRRNNSVTQSVRDVVGNFRQKLKKSTRQRKRLQDGTQSPVTLASRFRKNNKPKRTPTKKGGYRDVQMYSPFSIDTPRQRTPRGIRTHPRWHDVETPTRLRKEVEDLTANMQALVNLTPRTLQTRAASRRSLQTASPLTNGSLKSRRVTVIPMKRNEQITEM